MLRQQTTFTREILSSVKLLILLCILSFTVNADTSSATDGTTPLGLQPGAPAGAYALSDFDNVNLFNGNLSFQLSLLGISGRGSAQIPVLLPIEGKWRVLDIALPQINGSFKNLYMPQQEWWENNDRKYRPGSLVGRQGNLDEFTCPDNTTVYSATLKRLTFTAPDGTEYELRDLLTGGQVMGGAGCNYANPPSRGRIFVTADGSAATFVSDTTIYDNVISPNPDAEFFPSGYLMLRDGTRFRIESGRVVWMRDRNGNLLTFGYDSNNRIQTITDSLNRAITISRNTGPGTFDQITYRGFAGATRFVKINYSSLASALRSDYPGTLTYKSLFPALNGSTSSYHNPSVVSSITLPNNQQYIIKYNPFGEIARVVLPTGGAIEYDYAAGAGVDESGAFGGGYEGSWVIYRRVVERRVYPDGGSGSAYAVRMTYSRNESECAGCVKVDQLNSSGKLLNRSKHYFYGSAAMSFATGPTDYPGWQQGREYQTEEFADDGTSILRKTVNTWQQPIEGGSWPLGQPENNIGAKTNNPQVTQTVITQEPAQANKVSKQTFTYDKYTNRTDVYEYDFGNGAAGLLVRRTHTDFLTSSYDTLNPSSPNPDLNLTSHIRNLATQVSIFDAGGVERARSTTEYDNYALDGADCLHSFHCPLVPRANISGLDSLFSATYTKRGNATASTSFLLSNGSVTGSVSSYSQYDVAGNVVRVLDPRSTLANNTATTIEYDDRFGTADNEARSNTVQSELTGYTSFAFPTKVTNALGHTTYAQFDYYLGRPVNGEDANGVVASGSFDDLLDRPTQIRRAINTSAENQTRVAYDDTLRTVTVSSDRDLVNDKLLVSQIEYDQMGRTIANRQYEGGTNHIVTRTEYDALGRPYKNSNPYRPWQGETPVWTTQQFDALGRVLTVNTPDSAVVSTSYSGNTVTVTDQAGKARKSVTDALGRLIEVYEDPNGLAYQTKYTYDVLDDLVRVEQGTQQRFFMYDSLKRLIRGDNPELETLSTLSINDPVTGHGNWSVKYEYDNNGNLTSKTDARGVVTQNNYDVLNRLTTVLYRVNGQPDPNTGDTEFLYDNATMGKGRLWLTYRWGAKPSQTAVGFYDAMGRVKQLYNLFGDGQGGWSAGYEVDRNYNLAGAVTSQTYPSGRTVNYSYDAAGRTSSFTGYLGDGSQRTYATGISYSSWGTLSREQFGTNTAVYNKLHYNIRGQLCDVRASNVSDEWGGELGALANYYSANGVQCGSGSDNNGNVRKSQTIVNSYYMEDRYDYDSLNRLAGVSEYQNGTTLTGTQQYDYDRWGNRTIKPVSTIGVNYAFTVNPTTNRLGVPTGDTQHEMTYDKAGNLTRDTYTGAGNRVYDGDNHIVAAQGILAGWSYYTYNANAQRVRRNVNNQETWQIYGIDGEVVAEYAANGAAGAPQKEYGYRNGQLLVTAEPTTLQNVSWTNTAGVSVNGNSLTKTASTGWGNAGASSTQSVAAGDAYVEVTATETTTARLIGFSHTDTDQSWPSIDFAIDLDLSGSAYVFESGNNRGNFGPYATGDKFQVAIVGGVVKYKKNGTVFYSSNVTPTYPLVVDTALHANGCTLSSVVLSSGTNGVAAVRWLVPDHLGTPRIIIDQTGTLANLKRHDYLPFGEELFAPTGGRSAALGYTSRDGLRQQFTSKERDTETGLDYFGARYSSSTQGRFTSSDPLLSSGSVYAPQTWNRYSYTINNPLKYTDPFGMYICNGTNNQCKDVEKGLKNLEKARDSFKKGSNEYNRLDRSLKAYGAKGIDNGVTIKFGPTSSGSPAATHVSLKFDPTTGNKVTTTDNPTGQDITVTIDPTQTKSSDDYAINLGHEGSHVADGSDLIGSLPLNANLASDPAVMAVLNGPLNLTQYVTETRAYEVSSFIGQGRGLSSLTIGKAKYEIWNSGWREADRAAKRSAGIDKILAEPKSSGGLYEVTLANQGSKLIP